MRGEVGAEVDGANVQGRQFLGKHASNSEQCRLRGIQRLIPRYILQIVRCHCYLYRMIGGVLAQGLGQEHQAEKASVERVLNF